jgi:hypothetical protein
MSPLQVVADLQLQVSADATTALRQYAMYGSSSKLNQAFTEKYVAAQALKGRP